MKSCDPILPVEKPLSRILVAMFRFCSSSDRLENKKLPSRRSYIIFCNRARPTHFDDLLLIFAGMTLTISSRSLGQDPRARALCGGIPLPVRMLRFRAWKERLLHISVPPVNRLLHRRDRIHRNFRPQILMTDL